MPSERAHAFGSWGNYPTHAPPHRVIDPRTDRTVALGPGPILAYGMGRSYGDVCLNSNGTVIRARSLDRFIDLDVDLGILRCEAGVSLEEILRIIVPKGWFLPVTPGTKYVTLGGAIANDVHGKNHHAAGSFGCFVRCFELLRSNGERLVCSTEQNTELFRATIGGLGLTGLIVWAEIALHRAPTPYILKRSTRFNGFKEFLELSRAAEQGEEYIVAWLDATGSTKDLRGIFMSGSHAGPEYRSGPLAARRRINVPFNAPSWALNGLTVRAFNGLYLRQPTSMAPRLVHYDGFFYPLDSITNWNRLYGRHGFLQFQCVVPIDQAADLFASIVRRLRQTGDVSFLSVLKLFGDTPSPGLLSFPRAGATLALDIPVRGDRTIRTVIGLYDAVSAAGGALYPAKDAVMNDSHFLASFPNWERFDRSRDPAFSSDFIRRVFH